MPFSFFHMLRLWVTCRMLCCRAYLYGSADDYLAAMIKVEPILEEAAAAAADAAAAEAAKVGQERGDGVPKSKGLSWRMGQEDASEKWLCTVQHTCVPHVSAILQRSDVQAISRLFWV